MFSRSPHHAGRLAVTQLEDRVVPAPLNLVSQGDSGYIGDVFFRTFDAAAAGVKRLDSAVQLRPTRAGLAEGYNTDARPLLYNEANGPKTRSLLTDALPLVTVNGVLCRELLLDLNQSRGLPALSMDDLLVYVGDVPNTTGLVQTDGTLAGMTPVYDLDALGDTYVVMNYLLNGPRTAGDVQVYVPASLLPAGKFVTVYSHFGNTWPMDSGKLVWAPGTSPSETGPAAAIAPLSGPEHTGVASVSTTVLEEASDPISIDGASLVSTDSNPGLDTVAFELSDKSSGERDPLDPGVFDPILVG